MPRTYGMILLTFLLLALTNILILVNFAGMRSRYNELANVNQDLIELSNILRSNSQKVRELCTSIHDGDTIPEGWYPFEQWYENRKAGI